MDYIHQPSQGSAILAYGTSRSRRPFLRWGILIGAVIGLITCLYGVFILFAQAELPANRLVTIAINPARIQKKLTTEQIADLPDPWRSVIESKTHFPAYIGLYLNRSNQIESFAYLYAFPPIAESAETKIKKNGIFRLLITGENPSIEHIPFRHLLRIKHDLKKNDAAWVADLSRISTALFHTSQTEGGEISGTWSGLEGTIADIDIESDASEGFSLQNGLTSLFGKNTETSDIISASLLSQGFDIRALKTSPSAIRLSSDREIAIHFSNINEDQKEWLSAFNATETTYIILPDGSLAGRKASSTEIWSESSIILTKEGVTSSPPFLSEEITPICGGNLRFALSGDMLVNTLKSIKMPDSWNKRISQLEIRDQNGVIKVCLGSE